MRQTTRLIRSTIEEKRSFLVYCRSATSSNSWSMTVGLRAFSRTPWAITDSGEFTVNRSKTSLRIIAIASQKKGNSVLGDSLANAYAHLQRAGLPYLRALPAHRGAKTSERVYEKGG